MHQLQSTSVYTLLTSNWLTLEHVENPNGQTSFQYMTTTALASKRSGDLSTEFMKSDTLLRTCESFWASNESKTTLPLFVRSISSQ